MLFKALPFSGRFPDAILPMNARDILLRSRLVPSHGVHQDAGRWERTLWTARQIWLQFLQWLDNTRSSGRSMRRLSLILAVVLTRVGFTQGSGHWSRVGNFTTDHEFQCQRQNLGGVRLLNLARIRSLPEDSARAPEPGKQYPLGSRKDVRLLPYSP